jgi:hypothetical protein
VLDARVSFAQCGAGSGDAETRTPGINPNNIVGFFWKLIVQADHLAVGDSHRQLPYLTSEYSYAGWSSCQLFLLTFQKFRCIQDREFTPFLSLLWIGVKLTEATLSDL